MDREDFARSDEMWVKGFKGRLPSGRDVLDLANLYLRRHLKEIAVGYLALAAAMRPVDPSPRIGLGATLADLDQRESALSCLQSALDLGADPDTVESFRAEILGEKYSPDASSVTPWEVADYIVARRGDPAGNGGCLSIWIGPFAGQSDTVVANLLSTFCEFIESDILVVNTLAFSAQMGVRLDSFLHCLAIDLSPSTIFYFNPTLTLVTEMPRLETIAWMRHVSKAALIAICLDLAKPFYRTAIMLLAGECDLVVTTDQPAGRVLAERAGGRVMKGWHVVDIDAFTPRGQERDIEISFIGRIDGHYEYRKAFLDRLVDGGIGLFLGGSSVGRFLSNDDYADVMRRSRIALNFSGFEVVSTWDSHPLTGRLHPMAGEKHHLKARVFEIMESGALLLESENAAIKEWFEPGVHYIGFTDESDLLEKAQFYLANEAARAKIAEAGRLYARENYTPGAFWRGVFEPLRASGRFAKLPQLRRGEAGT